MRKSLAWFGFVSCFLAVAAMADPPTTVDRVGDEGVGTGAPVEEEIVYLGGGTDAGPVIFVNGGNLSDPFKVTRAGGHCSVNGDATDLQTTLGLNVYGFGAQASALNAMADDFTVPSGQTWTIDGITLYIYQTNATAPTITSVDYQWFLSDPLGLPPGPWTTKPVTATFTTAFKKLDTDGATVGCGRRIQKVTFDVVPPFVAPPGQYWLAWQALGSASYSGPWIPVLVFPGLNQAPGANAQQSVGGGAFALVLDTLLFNQQDVCFALHGSTGGQGAGDGDLNCDGVINAFDIDAFVKCLTTGTPTPPCTNCNNADINDDGVINAFDIDPFVVCLTTGVC